MYKKRTYDVEVDAPDEDLEEYTYDLPEYKKPEKKAASSEKAGKGAAGKKDTDELEIEKLETMSEKELDQEISGGIHSREDHADTVRLVILGVLLVMSLIALIFAGRYFFIWWEERQASQPLVVEEEKIQAGEKEQVIPDLVEKDTKDENAAAAKIDEIRTRRQKQEELYTISSVQGGYTYLATGTNIEVESVTCETDENGMLMLARVTGMVSGEISEIEIIYEDEEPVFVSVESNSGEWQFYLENRKLIRVIDETGAYTDFSTSEAVNPVYFDRGAAVRFALDMDLGFGDREETSEETDMEAAVGKDAKAAEETDMEAAVGKDMEAAVEKDIEGTDTETAE